MLKKCGKKGYFSGGLGTEAADCVIAKKPSLNSLSGLSCILSPHSFPVALQLSAVQIKGKDDPK